MISQQELLALAGELCDAPSGECYRQAVGRALAQYLRCDRVYWMNPGDEPAMVWPIHEFGLPTRPTVDKGAHSATDWRRPALSGECDRNVLTLGDDRGTSARGWIAIRDTGDFGGDETATVTLLSSLLLMLDRVRHGPTEMPPADARHEQLTARERQTLDLLRTGMTARAIGATMGISSRTVSKHLEHVYDKLGRHDRLLATSK